MVRNPLGRGQPALAALAVEAAMANCRRAGNIPPVSWVNALTCTGRTVTGPVAVRARCTTTGGLVGLTGAAVSSGQLAASLSSIRPVRLTLVASPVIVAPLAEEARLVSRPTERAV